MPANTGNASPRWREAGERGPEPGAGRRRLPELGGAPTTFCPGSEWRNLRK